MIILPQGFACRPLNIRDASKRGSVLASLIYAAGSFCLSAMLTSLIATLLFAISNGSLGQHRLAHVGVDVMASTRAVGHPMAWGLAVAWLIAVVGHNACFFDRLDNRESQVFSHHVPSNRRSPSGTV